MFKKKIDVEVKLWRKWIDLNIKIKRIFSGSNLFNFICVYDKLLYLLLLW